MANLDGYIGDREVLAGNLTLAAHIYMLSMQLRGKGVTFAEALESVRSTYEQVLSGALLQQETYHRPSPQRESTLAPASSSEKEISPTDYTNEAYQQRPGQISTVLSHSSDALAGKMLDNRYYIIKPLGEGGMGAVYLGEQISTKRKVAVKVMRSMSQTRLDEALSFFRQEAAALAKLNHPSIAQIYDSSITGDALYIAMEYIEGESLRERLDRQGALPVGEAVRILREICAGLEIAHNQGIIHRDMKPENIMLVKDHKGDLRIKILDFGLAILDNKDAIQNLSGAGMVAGTPAYMSPEQVNGLQVTTATDVYSLGVIGYEMLTGQNPFQGKSAIETMSNHCKLVPVALRSLVPGITQVLDSVILEALDKDPAKRFSTAGDFVLAL